MLIPAFSMMGAGVAQVLQITYGNQYVNRDPKRQVEILGASNNALPPPPQKRQNLFVKKKVSGMKLVNLCLTALLKTRPDFLKSTLRMRP